MSMAFGSKLGLEPGGWAEMIYNVCIGVVVGSNHSISIISNWWYMNIIQPFFIYFHFIDEPITAHDADKKLKVVAVGYGRTGTYSLKLALDELGFPTLHTQHLYEHEEIINRWTTDIFLPSIKAKKATKGIPDFQLIADHGFLATADLPMALYFEEIYELYPDCKFILTTRENSEIWFRSWDTLTQSITDTANLGGYIFSNARRYSYYLRWLFSIVNDDNSYLTMSAPFSKQNKTAAIHSYEEHNRKVRSIIPSEQLLEYNVNQGWEPLCSFLELPSCPSTAFPKTNSATSVQVQALSAILAPLIATLFIVFFGFSRMFLRITGLTIYQWVNWKSKELNLVLRKGMLGDRGGLDVNYSHLSKKI